MSHLKENAPNQSIKFYKNLRKRLYTFSFYIQNSNNISFYVYSLVLHLDLLVIMILPMESILDFQRADKLSANKKISYTEFNFYYKLLNKDWLVFVTDGINIYLLAFLILLMAAFVKLDLKKRDLKHSHNPFHSAISFLCILNGRSLIFVFLSFQLLAVRCAFDDYCLPHKSSTTALITNSLGILACLASGYVQYSYQYSIFPQLNIPWAMPRTYFRLLKRLSQFLCVLILILIDFWVDVLSFYVVLIPLFLIQTLILWILLSSRVAFHFPIEVAHCLVDSFIWTILFYALVIEITHDSTDITYLIMVVFTTVALFTALQLGKRHLQHSKLSNFRVQSPSQQQSLIHTVIRLLHCPEGSYEHMLLKQVHTNHVWTCTDSECPCKQLSNNSGKQEENDALMVDSIELEH